MWNIWFKPKLNILLLKYIVVLKKTPSDILLFRTRHTNQSEYLSIYVVIVLFFPLPTLEKLNHGLPALCSASIRWIHQKSPALVQADGHLICFYSNAEARSYPVFREPPPSAQISTEALCKVCTNMRRWQKISRKDWTRAAGPIVPRELWQLPDYIALRRWCTSRCLNRAT